MKKILSILLSLCVVSSTLMISTPAKAASSVVESAISWAVAIANDNSHGYSQSSRWGPDYDCSSFVISAFRNAGIDTGTATYTGNMRSQFTQHGFQWIPWSQIGGIYNLQRGDILLNEATHTEIYLGNNQNVGAHSNRGYPQTGDQTGTEVSVSGYYNHPWDGVLRYTASSPCTCSTNYAGNYYVSTNSLPLTMRSGHGTEYSTVTSIPKGSQVYVSRSDGNWAHVEWNGYSGYCSMTYLTKVNEQAKSYQLHVWVSDTTMGDVPSKYTLGSRYYICYELIDETTGKKANETSNINYNATETIRNSSGAVFEHTYEKSDYNWISIVCNTEDTYTGTVTISGDLSISCTVSFVVYAETGPQIKAWVWEGDDSNEVSNISVGKTAYCSYLIRDKYTEKNLNDVTTFWTSGNGYKVTVNVYAPDGSLVKTKSYKNADCSWIDFIPNKTGDYKIVTEVSGNLTGTYEKAFTSIETEHSYSSWKTTKSATCTETGTKIRTCSICGKTETQTIAATGHKYTSNIVKPTTSEKGYTLYTCTICNYSYKDNYTNIVENPSFTLDAAGAVNSGKTVTLTAKGGTSYKFLIYNPATNQWFCLRDYSNTNTYKWTASGSGTRIFYVDIKDAYGNVKRLQQSLEVKQGLTVTGSAGKSSVTVGDSIKINAAASGGDGGYTYSFLIHNKDTNQWSRLTSSFITANTYTWTAGSAGNREFFVEVKDKTGKVVRSGAVNVSVSEKPLAVTGKASTSAAVKGEKVIISGTASGGSGPYTYSYLVHNKDTNAWSRLTSSFMAANTYTWTAGSAGNREFFVEVKDSTGKVVRSNAVNVSTKASSPLEISGKANIASVIVGNKVVISGTASGGNGPYTYSYLVHNKDTNAWSRLTSSFITANTYTWTAGSAGNREFFVEVKDNTGKVVRSNAINVKAEKKSAPLTINAGATSSKVSVGGKVVILGAGSGGSGDYTYSYLIHNKDTNQWSRLTPSFIKNNTYTWIAGSTGNREFFVEVKDSTGKIVRSSAVYIAVK